MSSEWDNQKYNAAADDDDDWDDEEWEEEEDLEEEEDEIADEDDWDDADEEWEEEEDLEEEEDEIVDEDDWDDADEEWEEEEDLEEEEEIVDEDDWDEEEELEEEEYGTVYQDNTKKTLDDYTDAELGRMLKQAASGRKQEALEAVRSQNSLVRFLEDRGLYQIAALVKSALRAWERIKVILRDIFG